MPADAGIRFGNYVLVRRIARGGMAEVFLAQQRGLEGFDRRVAVKRILPHLADSPDFVKMFFGEAKLAAQLSHPNIVHIYEFGKVENDYFIAMEFVDGVHAGQLFKHGNEKDKLPAVLIARMGADAATALHYAHELRGGNGKLLGLVHRDVSPANIMVSFDGVVKLCDFGIAKAAAAGDQLTNPGQVKGKYAYMSPEQTIAAQLDGRSDVFSLAIVMWELLAGKYIVPRGDAVAAMRAIRDGKLDPIDKVAPDIPPALAKAITWALEPKRDKRATAADFAQALEAFLKSAPELATAMQLGGWIRARFVREGTGQLPALTPSSGAVPAMGQSSATPGGTSVASPGTVVSPGTMVGQGTAVGPVTQLPVTQLPVTPGPYPPRRVVKLLSDTGEGTEIYSTADLDEQAETIKGARPPKGPKPKIADTVRSNRAADEATVRAPPPFSIGDATEIVRNTPGTPFDDDSDAATLYETTLRDRRGPMPSGGTPTRVQPMSVAVSESAARALPEAPVPQRPSQPHIPGPRAAIPDAAARVAGTGPRGALQSEPRARLTPLPPELLRRKRRKMIVGLAGLGGLMLLSFMIALAASNKTPVAAPQDAAVVEMTADATLVIAPPPVDAAVVPTIPVDAAAAAVVDDPGQAYLVVRTIPDGGNVTVGDQVRVAAKMANDPTGSATAKFVVAPGHHIVTADLPGYAQEKRDVVVGRGEHRQMEITFTKKIEKRPDRGPTGYLTVRTTPWSDVYLSGKKLGQAPFADLELPVGTHTLTFKNPSRPTVTKTVTIKAGKSAKLNFSLP